MFSGFGNASSSANIANLYDATITYSDSSTATIASADFWSGSNDQQNRTFSFTNPNPDKEVYKLRISFYSYSSNAFDGILAYLGHD